MPGDLTGHIIKGYELKELTGVGGFGEVYRAYQQLVNREVAIKIILPQYANQPDFIRRFENEAQLIARLEHPYIVPLYDYWREPDGAFLVMRWLRGGNVLESIQKGGPWPARRAQAMLIQIAEALAVAHRNGVIHRDLKPENIMLDEDGNAYLTDFGIAKTIDADEQTRANAILGSPAYLSPEQIQNQPITFQTDIYTLGIVLYEVLTGKQPFPDADSSAAILYKHLTETLPELELNDAALSTAINSIIQKATAKNPEYRYDDPISLAREFGAAIRGLDAKALPASEMATTMDSATGIILPEPENPYKGLRAFQQADSQDFFGREALVERILSRLQETTDDSRFLAVVGPSGSGKSSVVKAGVIPQLRRDGINGSKDWFIVEMVPGLDPFEELEVALLRVAVNPPESLRKQLIEDERGLLRAARRILPDDGTELLIVIDQFEELYTLVAEEQTRDLFMDNLIEAVSNAYSPVRVIMTLRADFYDRPLNYGHFGNLMRDRTEIVLPLSTTELERAVRGPAERIKMLLDPALLPVIIGDVSDQPGALPLLQYALTELFERRDGNALTLDAYQEIGGVMGALARRAEELYANLPPQSQEATRQFFLRLVTLGEGTEDTRRRLLQHDLLALEVDREVMATVIDAFGKYRLLTFDHDPATRAATVEIAHEALIREWKRLREWLDASRDDLRAQRHLNASAEEWTAANRDSSFLLRGANLAQYQDWANDTTLVLTGSEAEYLKASIAVNERHVALERERAEREAALEQRSRGRLRALLAVMTVAAVIGTVLAAIAFTQRQQAQDARLNAETNALIARKSQEDAEHSAAEARSLALAANANNALIQHNPPLGLALARQAALAFEPVSTEVLRTLATSAYGPGVIAQYQDHDGSIPAVAISTDGSLSASGSLDGTIKIKDLATGDIVHSINIEDGIGAALDFNPDATLLAASHADRNVYLYDVETGEMVTELSGHNDIVTSLQFSADGEQILSGSLDRTMILWGLETGEIIRQFESDGGVVIDVALNPQRTLAASSTGDETSAPTRDDVPDRKVRLFDVETGEVVAMFDPQSGYARQVTFSSDGQHLAAASWNSAERGIIDIWDVQTSEKINKLFGHTDFITALTFGPDNDTLYSAGADQTMRVWNVHTGLEMLRFDTFATRPLSIDISGDGALALVGTGNYGNELIDLHEERAAEPHMWLIDLNNRALVRTIGNLDDWAWSVDVSPDGRYAASGFGPLRPPVENMDTSVRIFEIASGEEVRQLEGHYSTVEAVNYTPDGSQIVTGGWDGQLILWDAETGAVVHTYEDPELELDPVSIIVDDEIVPAPVQARAMAGNIMNARFTPDGETLLSASSEGYVAVWDVETGDLIRKFGDHEDAIAGIAISPDGARLATGSWDNTAKLWNLEAGQELQHFTGHTNLINDVAFSPDGRYILTAGWDNLVRMWDVETGAEVRQFMGHNGQVQTVTFNAAGTLALSAGGDTTVRLWDVATGKELFTYNDHSDWVSQVHFLPDERFAISSGQDKTLRLWQVPAEPESILDWASENRYMPELTCEQRLQFRIEPLCDSK